MQENFAESSKRAVKVAEELAEKLGDESVATGHLIYGIAVDEGTCVHHVFKDLNIDPDMFAGYVKTLPREPEVDFGAPFNRHVQTVFERGAETAEALGCKEVKPEHLAIGLLSVKAGSAYETLKEFSIDPKYVQILILETMGLEAEDAPDWF